MFGSVPNRLGIVAVAIMIDLQVYVGILCVKRLNATYLVCTSLSKNNMRSNRQTQRGIQNKV